MIEPVFALACRFCGQRPSRDSTMGVFRAHVENEHPDQVKEDGSPDLQMDMVVVCPHCDVVAPLTRTMPLANGRQLTIHDCPNCHRTYRVTSNGGDS